MKERDKLVTELAAWFRGDFGRRLERVFELAAEEMSMDYALMKAVICAEALSLSAHCHEGDREAFIQMARDAYAVATTGELEQ